VLPMPLGSIFLWWPEDRRSSSPGTFQSFFLPDIIFLSTALPPTICSVIRKAKATLHKRRSDPTSN